MLCRSEDKVNSIELVPGVEDRLCWVHNTCWAVWLARNGLVFEIKMMTMETLIFQSKMRALLWLRCRIDTIKSR
ncbi:hypothetical protein Gotur_007672 [Gossypium turneri]